LDEKEKRLVNEVGVDPARAKGSGSSQKLTRILIVFVSVDFIYIFIHQKHW